MASASPRARRRSTRCTRRSTASRRSSTKTLDELTRELVAAQRPDVVAITAPFPGNVYGAFRMARTIRALAPEDDARARRRLGQHRAARLARAARVRLLRLRHARRRRAAAAESADAPARPATRRWCAPTCARHGEVVLETDAHAARHPAEGHGHPDVRRLAARAVRVRDGDAEPDASVLVGRPLEQDHAGARLLLEEMFVLRRLARLHRPLRRAEHRPRHAAHSRADRGDRRDRLPPRRRSRAAGARCARSRSACIAEKLEHHVVGQHPLREDLHARALPAARAKPAAWP